MFVSPIRTKKEFVGTLRKKGFATEIIDTGVLRNLSGPIEVALKHYSPIVVHAPTGRWKLTIWKTRQERLQYD